MNDERLLELLSNLEDDSENIESIEIYIETLGLDIENLTAGDLSTVRGELKRKYPDYIIEINLIIQLIKDYMINITKKEALLRPPFIKKAYVNKTEKSSNSATMIITKGDSKVGYYRDWR